MPAQPKNVVARLGELLAARMGRNSRLSLSEALFAEGGAFEPEAELVRHLLDNREELSSWMHAVLREEPHGHRWEQTPEAFLRSLLAPWLHEKNQFFRVGEEAARQLEAIYRRAIAETALVLSSRTDDALASEKLRSTWEAHRVRLASFARAHLGEDPRDVVCATYSPPLQLGVLGLSAGGLLEPVLDVGCGRDAALVLYLRERGVKAYGIDRVAPAGLAGVTSADWLDVDYGEETWGTVFSHLGFSLHFMRHDLTDGPVAESLALAHARAYTRILRSLRIGGTFAYAPALQFVEELLPAPTFECGRVAFPDELVTPALAAARARTGLDLAQSSRVTRLA
jgi:hypothetical protein